MSNLIFEVQLTLLEDRPVGLPPSVLMLFIGVKLFQFALVIGGTDQLYWGLSRRKRTVIQTRTESCSKLEGLKYLQLDAKDQAHVLLAAGRQI